MKDASPRSRLPTSLADALSPKETSHLAALDRAGFLQDVLDQVPPDAPEETWRTLVADLLNCDLGWIQGLREALRAPPAGPLDRELVPVSPLRLEDPRAETWRERGQEVLGTGAVASLIFAGGAATRFFSEAAGDPEVEAVRARLGGHPPKGLFPLLPVLRRSFLEVFLAEALEAGLAAGVLPPVVLMTSQQTQAAIRQWMAMASLEGYPRELLWEMPQQEHPRLDAEGRLLVLPDGHLVRTGDGHGGVFAALLRRSPDGSVRDRLQATGVRTLVMHNVDNARARPFEPTRLGVHQAFAFTMTVAPRSHVREKVGLVAQDARTGRIEVIEYSVCPPEVADAVDPDGRPRFRFGHLNTNLVALDAIRTDLPRTLYTGKKVEIGGRVVLTASHEMLNQHLSSLLPPDQVGILEVPREDFFLPTKSLRGEDSLVQTREALARAHRRRLEAAGARVDPSARVELHPCLAEGPWPLPPLRNWEIGPGASLALACRHDPRGEDAPLGEGLRLGAGATLVLDAERPRGSPSVTAGTRQVQADPMGAGRVLLGRGVVVADGAEIRCRVLGDGCLVLPDGARLEGHHEVLVSPGETRVWSMPVE